MAVGAGVEFPFAAGDGLVVKVEIASLGLIPGRFFPTFELGGIQLGRERRPVGASRWVPAGDLSHLSSEDERWPEFRNAGHEHRIYPGGGGAAGRGRGQPSSYYFVVRATDGCGGNETNTQEMAVQPLLDPAKDQDRDGMANMVESALASNPSDAADAHWPAAVAVEADGSRHLAIRFIRRKNDTAASIVVESSGDLGARQSGPAHTDFHPGAGARTATRGIPASGRSFRNRSSRLAHSEAPTRRQSRRFERVRQRAPGERGNLMIAHQCAHRAGGPCPRFPRAGGELDGLAQARVYRHLSAHGKRVFEDLWKSGLPGGTWLICGGQPAACRNPQAPAARGSCLMIFH